MRRRASKQRRDAGMSLVELLISMVILAVALSALATLFFAASATNTRNARDTGSVMVAKMVMEAATSQHINSDIPTTITDCAGNVWTVGVLDVANPGSGALLDTNTGSLTYGGIDRINQTYAAVPTNFKMQYVDCNGATYDVRWNSMTMSPNVTRLITVSAQQVANQQEGLTFIQPVSLRGVGGP